MRLQTSYPPPVSLILCVKTRKEEIFAVLTPAEYKTASHLTSLNNGDDTDEMELIKNENDIFPFLGLLYLL